MHTREQSTANASEENQREKDEVRKIPDKVVELHHTALKIQRSLMEGVRKVENSATW